VSQGTTFLKLKPWDERTPAPSSKSPPNFAPQMMAIPGGRRLFRAARPPLGQGIRRQADPNGDPEPRGPMAELQVMVDKDAGQKPPDNPGLVNVDTDLKLKRAAARKWTSTATKAAAVGVEVETLGRTLENPCSADARSPRFKREGEQYDVIVKGSPTSTAATPKICAASMCAGRGDTMIPAVEP